MPDKHILNKFHLISSQAILPIKYLTFHMVLNFFLMQQISGFKTSLNSYLNLIKYKIQVHLITQIYIFLNNIFNQFQNANKSHSIKILCKKENYKRPQNQNRSFTMTHQANHPTNQQTRSSK